MKMMKKIATLLLAVCLVIPCFSMLTYAANGKIMFTDPTTAVGETLELMGVLEADGAIEDRTIVMTYDTNMLKFTSGDNVTETAAGQLTYEVKGEQTGTRVEFLMYFEVLQAGTTTVGVESYTAYTTSGNNINCTKGSSTITIAEGEAVVTADDSATVTAASAIVDVNGVSYTFSDEFPNSDIPEGFVASTLEYAGVQHRVVVQDSTGICLGYLVDGNAEGKFFMYVEDNATFVPFEQIEISETTVITILSSVENITLPDPYVATTVTINEVEFPAWQNTEKQELCILYALNNRGEKAFYQFDTEEGTYQRFEIPKEETEEEDTTVIGEIRAALGEHLDYVILGVGLGLIFFLILIIVLSVKLYNRNAELDELYDEYGIDLDEDDDSDDGVVIDMNDEEEEPEFEEIEDEVEDDITFEETTSNEEISVEEISEEEAPKEEVKKELTLAEELFGEDDTKEALKVVEAELLADENEYLDEGDELDFEMDFIDLDD